MWRFLLLCCGTFVLAHGDDEHTLEDWIEPPTADIKSCLSPDLEQEERQTCRFFAAVIDAGSTGTRLHLFEFSHDPQHVHSPFRLEREIFKKNQPGLSSFAHEPELAAKSVGELIKAARENIPSSLWAHTPIVMKATAGLRLLPADQADGILFEVESEIEDSGLLVTEDSVGVLSGTDEGVFGWFTLNFLTDRLNHVLTNAKHSAVALDLGGGSTQITFVPIDPTRVFNPKTTMDEFGHLMKIFGHKVGLYTHSYLGNGLIAARLGIGQLLVPQKQTGDHQLVSYCFPRGFTLKDLDYAGNGVIISGAADSSFSNCMNSAKQYVKNTKIRNVASELKDRDIYVFAYFFDRAEQAGLTFGEEQTGGLIKVGDYAKKAEEACALDKDHLGPEHWRPWQCLDLCYIYSLLRHGYGLEDDKDIFLTKKLKTMEASWALGAGFHLLNTYHDYSQQQQQQQNPANCENSTSPNTTYMAQLYEFISVKATEILTVFRIIS